MAWVVLVISGALEAVWATALDRSDGFRNLIPVMVFVVGLVLSMGGLSYALRTLPLGVSYVVWVGVGSVLTVVSAMVFGGEPVTPLKVLLLLVIVGCVTGLRILGS